MSAGDAWIPNDEEYIEMCRLCESSESDAFKLFKTQIDLARRSRPVCKETFSPGADSNEKNRKVPLVLAAYSGNAHIVRYLLTEFSSVIDVNCRGDIHWRLHRKPAILYQRYSYELQIVRGVTALWAACYCGNLEIVRLLLRVGADVNAATTTTETAAIPTVTPMEIAAYNGHCEIMELLYSYKADVNIGNDQDYSPLMAATAANQVNAVIFLLERGVDVSQKNSKGYSVFHVAVAYSSLDVIRVLRRKGFLPNFELPQLNTIPCPYFLAMHFGYQEVATKLKQLHTHTKEYESESYLLIGARCAVKKHHQQLPMQNILDNWRKGVRLREECRYMPNFFPISDVYAGLHEIVTEEDLAGPSKDSGLDMEMWIRYQGLLIKERIAGPPYMLQALLNCGSVFCEKKMFRHAELLWLQLIEYYSTCHTKIFVSNELPNFKACMYEYACGIRKMVLGHYRPKFSKFVQFGLTHLTKMHFVDIITLILWIFVSWIQSNGGYVDSDKCEELGRKFVSQHFHITNKMTLLHLAVSNFKIHHQRAHTLFQPHYQSLILALLRWGCDQELFTVRGFAHPIHMAVKVGNEYNINIVTPLLKYGCSPLFVNSHGQTALQLATSDMMSCTLRPYSLSLFDMCCIAMVQYRFPYDSLELPTAIKNRIRLFDKNSRCNNNM